MHCPKCAWEQGDGRVECDRCGIIFSKFTASPRRAAATIHDLPVPEPSWVTLAKDWLFRVEESVNPFYFAGRALIFVVLTLWA